uniref:Uncharacterized protein n=1 Tax=Bracon brevicornis TaxID=1563983 RepID=A0A6V7LWG3_9HYME
MDVNRGRLQREHVQLRQFYVKKPVITEATIASFLKGENAISHHRPIAMARAVSLNLIARNMTVTCSTVVGDITIIINIIITAAAAAAADIVGGVF